MAEASLTVSSKNYSSWSLRGFLLCRMAGLEFAERVAPSDDPATRAELLLLSPSFLVPCLEHGTVKVGKLDIAPTEKARIIEAGRRALIDEVRPAYRRVIALMEVPQSQIHRP